MMIKKIVLMCFIGVPSLGMASNYTGTINELRFSVGATPARVSINIGQPTSCPKPGWYTFEDADSGIGKIWTSVLLTAHAAQRSVRIAGTGTCDTYGYETVLYIDII